MEAQKKVANRLAEARENRGWKQNELSRRSGVSAACISRYEQAEQVQINIYNLLAIVDTLGVSLDWVFERSDDERVK